MQRFCRNVGLIVILGVVLACALSCGGKKGKKGGSTTAKHHTEKSEEVGYDYQVFAPLPKIITEEPSMPMLVDQTGIVETACFEPLKLEPEIAGLNVKKTLEENSDTLNQIIRRWVVDDIAPSGLSLSDTDKWEITASSPLAMGIDTDMLRFAEDQGCIQADTGWLAKDVHAATTLFGAKSFLFETNDPIGVEMQDQMAEAFKDKGLIMKSEALEYYRPALDEEGQQKKDKDGNYLYTSPGGMNIVEAKLPPEKDRGMKEWTLEAEKPIYFAFSELPDEDWVKESKKNHCDVYLIWGDVTPRAPECEEFTTAIFTAKKNKDNTVSVEVTIGKEVKKVDISWETTQKLEFDKRIILWINAKEDKEGEGISIRTNSITIGKQR